MNEQQFYTTRCRRSDLLFTGCACCMGYGNRPTPPDLEADEKPRMDALGRGNDHARNRCPSCHEDIQIGEATSTDLVGLRTHWECRQ